MPASRHITCPALRPVFSHSSVPPVRLDIPPPPVLRMFFVPLPLSHLSPLPTFLEYAPRLPVSCLPVFPPPQHPILSCPSRMIFFLYTAPPPIHRHWMDERAVVIICGLPTLSSSSSSPPSYLCRPAITHCRVLASFPIGPVSLSSPARVSGDPSQAISVSYHITTYRQPPADQPLLLLPTSSPPPPPTPLYPPLVLQHPSKSSASALSTCIPRYRTECIAPHVRCTTRGWTSR
jgi:hypothetical protein